VTRTETTVARRTLKNDVDRRMDVVVRSTNVFMSERDILALDRRNLSYYIETLRVGEAEVRKLRKRLEALQAGVEKVCARDDCQHPVAGRSDARYCSDRCRIHAHRRSNG
jgi:hypothetical protein